MSISPHPDSVSNSETNSGLSPNSDANSASIPSGSQLSNWSSTDSQTPARPNLPTANSTSSLSQLLSARHETESFIQMKVKSPNKKRKCDSPVASGSDQQSQASTEFPTTAAHTQGPLPSVAALFGLPIAPRRARNSVPELMRESVSYESNLSLLASPTGDSPRASGSTGLAHDDIQQPSVPTSQGWSSIPLPRVTAADTGRSLHPTIFHPYSRPAVHQHDDGPTENNLVAQTQRMKISGVQRAEGRSSGREGITRCTVACNLCRKRKVRCEKRIGDTGDAGCLGCLVKGQKCLMPEEASRRRGPATGSRKPVKDLKSDTSTEDQSGARRANKRRVAARVVSGYSTVSTSGSDRRSSDVSPPGSSPWVPTQLPPLSPLRDLAQLVHPIHSPPGMQFSASSVFQHPAPVPSPRWEHSAFTFSAPTRPDEPMDWTSTSPARSPPSNQSQTHTGPQYSGQERRPMDRRPSLFGLSGRDLPPLRRSGPSDRDLSP